MSDILPKRVNTGRYKRAASRAKSQSKSAFSRRASRIEARSRSNTRYTQNTENTEGNEDFGTTETSFGQETSNSRNERSEESPSRDRLYRNSFNRQNSLGQNSLGPISESESIHSKSTKNFPINIHRPIYTEKQVYRDYGDREGKYLQYHQKFNKKRSKGLKNRLLEPFQHPLNYFKRRLPPLKWVPEYRGNLSIRTNEAILKCYYSTVKIADFLGCLSGFLAVFHDVWPKNAKPAVKNILSLPSM